ncbi:hypothetical protein TWF696_002943 [Orbilia brochopaga]|uniref:Uncharacterized protein n=1 Tax=Orbilia brochopaga TaxID=3140254 RepID=A0AAV9U188_9PEZI
MADCFFLGDPNQDVSLVAVEAADINAEQEEERPVEQEEHIGNSIGRLATATAK